MDVWVSFPTKMGANNTNDSTTEIEKTQKKVSHCWGNAQIPFALPFLTLPNSNLATFLSPPQLHSSFTAVADHFFTLLHSLASQNPFLNKIISLPSQFHTLCVQVLLNFPLFSAIYVPKIMPNLVVFGFRFGSRIAWDWWVIIILLLFYLGIRWQDWLWLMGFWISWTFTTPCSLLGLFWHGFPTLLLPLLVPSGEMPSFVLLLWGLHNYMFFFFSIGLSYHVIIDTTEAIVNPLSFHRLTCIIKYLKIRFISISLYVINTIKLLRLTLHRK